MVFLICKCLRRAYDYGVTCVDPYRIQVLHITYRDGCVISVAHHFILNLLVALYALFDQDLAYRGEVESVFHQRHEIIGTVCKSAACTAERECGAKHHRVADPVRCCKPFLYRRCCIGGQRGFTQFFAQLLELFAVFRAFYGYASGAEQLSMRNIQVLSPTRKGECGVNVLNLRLQEALNPPKPGIPEFSHSGNIFRLGDKVIQIHNDYDLAWVRETDDGPEKGKGVLNGDIGFITEVNPGASSLTVRFDDERDVKYEADDLENLELAYCLSVHKAQGSEFPTVILSVAGGPPMLMTRNLLYTALTRAQKLVVLVGQEEIIQRMVENNYVLRRYTALSQRLTEAQELRP